MKIGLIDDDSTTNFINKVKLEKFMPSSEIFIFSNGKEAIDFLKKGNSLDLALLDLNMPIMNGMQFLLAHRELDLSCKIKKIILFIEEKIDFEFKQKNNIHLAIRKPLDEEKMKLIFENSIQIEDEIIKDLQPEILKQALSIFKRNTIEELEKITILYANNNIEDVQKLAHKLRGSSASVGLNVFSKIAEEIETNCGSNNSIDELLLKLKLNFKEIIVFLNQKYGIE